jgi:3-oxoacyl-[acyl-carrier-protein] synthase-3
MASSISVGLLNIGQEDIKGNDVVKQTGELLKASGLNFTATSRHRHLQGTTDVTVWDGFVGNIALKTSEGLATMLADYLREEFTRNAFRKVLAVFALPALRSFKRRVDPRRYNGAPLVELKGVVVKSHGGADVLAFRYALRKAYAEAAFGVLDRIAQRIAAMPAPASGAAPPAGGRGRRPSRPSEMFSKIAGTGGYLPAQVLTNDELSRRVDTSDEWIRTRTGIRQRHIAAADEQTSDLALAAERRALEAAGLAAPAVDLIVVATTTPDMVFPSTACILQAKLGTKNGPAFDVQAVCSGFVYALGLADLMVRSGQARNALVVGAEIYSRILDWHDRGTCVLFGDGAGAVVLVPATEPGILSTHLHADGHYRDILAVPGTVANGAISGRPLLTMEGNAVFKFAVKVLAEVCHEALTANGLPASAIDWLIPHQANLRIMEATAKKLHLPLDKMITTVDKHANTSAASIPLALDLAVRDGRIRAGHHVMLAGVGGGFTWGSTLLRWEWANDETGDGVSRAGLAGRRHDGRV